MGQITRCRMLPLIAPVIDAHAAPRTTTLYDRTAAGLTLADSERIGI